LQRRNKGDPVKGYLFIAAEVCIGAIVGTCVNKTAESSVWGWVLALTLGFAAIVESIAVAVALSPGIFILTFVWILIGQCFVSLVLLTFTSAGYWIAYVITRRLGIGRGQFGIKILVLLITIYATVAAIMRLNH
jgi:hypothetical protein